MISMSYCRFENTYLALKECHEMWWDSETLSDKEAEYEKKLIELMKQILKEHQP